MTSAEQELDAWTEVWGPDDPRAAKMSWLQFVAASGANDYLADHGRFARFRKSSEVLEELGRRYALILEQAVDQAPDTAKRLFLKLSPITPQMVFTKESVRAEAAAGIGSVPGYGPPGPPDLEPLVRGLFGPAYDVGPIAPGEVQGHRVARARGTTSDPAHAPVRVGAVLVDASDGFTAPVYVDAFAPAEAAAADQRLDVFLDLLAEAFRS